MRIFLIIVMSSMITTANFAVAQTSIKGSADYDVDKYAISGKSTQLANLYSLQANCSPMDWIEVSVAKQPEHGKLTISDKKTSVFYSKENSRSSCNGKIVTGKAIQYLSPSDYKGPDEVIVEIITSEGQLIKYIFRIIVK